MEAREEQQSQKDAAKEGKKKGAGKDGKVYLGYSWLLLPIHSEVITFESSFNDCFESSIPHTMKN